MKHAPGIIAADDLKNNQGLKDYVQYGVHPIFNTLFKVMRGDYTIGEAEMSDVFSESREVNYLFEYRTCPECKRTVRKEEIMTMADGEICQSCYDKLLMRY